MKCTDVWTAAVQPLHSVHHFCTNKVHMCVCSYDNIHGVHTFSVDHHAMLLETCHTGNCPPLKTPPPPTHTHTHCLSCSRKDLSAFDLHDDTPMKRDPPKLTYAPPSGNPTKGLSKLQKREHAHTHVYIVCVLHSSTYAASIASAWHCSSGSVLVCLSNRKPF